MRAFRGRVVAKTGAEGLICMGLMGKRRGIALKISDGSARAVGPAALDALRRCGWITEEEYIAHDLDALRNPRYPDSLMRPAADLRAAGG
jgi:L-asparaginase II